MSKADPAFDRRDELVVLFGAKDREEIVLHLAKKGLRIAAAVVPRRRTLELEESLDRLRFRGIRHLECDRAELRETLKSFHGQVLLSIGFPFLISPDILASFKLCLNVHPTLLPRYRGPMSGAFIIRNGEREAGSTVHVIDSGMDTGPIVLQRRVLLTRFDTTRSMQRKVRSIEPQLVADALDLLQDPAFTPTDQDEACATTYPKRVKPADSEIDPTRRLIELYDTIRACDPTDYPAFFFVDGQKVCVRFWRPGRLAEEGDDTL